MVAGAATAEATAVFAELGLLIDAGAMGAASAGEGTRPATSDGGLETDCARIVPSAEEFTAVSEAAAAGNDAAKTGSGICDTRPELTYRGRGDSGGRLAEAALLPTPAPVPFPAVAEVEDTCSSRGGRPGG